MSASVTHAETPVIPVANFSSNVTEGYTPLAVQFNDSFENATGQNLNFGAGRYISTWSEVTPNADWSGRSGHSAVFRFDSIVVMGGYNGTYLNDVWRSTDNGAMWTEMNSSAGWSGRSGHTAIVSPFDGSIVIMGGNDDSTYFNDVWRSTDSGFTWEEVTPSAGWSGRSGHTAIVSPLDGSIVIMGGNDGTNNLNDVWRSTDGGETWTEVTPSATWSVRSGHSAVSLPDGSIVVMGGHDNSTYFNDSWLSIDNGVTWVSVSFNADWFGRSGHSAVSLPDGSIVIIGGYDGFIYPFDVWHSTDSGATWSDVTPGIYWSGRSGHSAVSLPDGSIVVMGGNDDTNNLNDVWRLQLYELPVANFSSNVTSGYAPLSVEFTDSSENATAWNWDFGDGSNSTDQNTTHTYSVAGNYTVNLTVSNLNGTDSTESTIIVTEAPVLPVANFTSNVTEGYAPLTVEFTDSSENATSWIWDFGDGSNSTDQNTTYTYSVAGNYTVNLTVSNLNGTDSKTANITVLSEEPVLPVANFSSNISSGYAPLTVEFTAGSENATELFWDFGDGFNSTEQNPVHTYSTVGNYTVNLTAINGNGTDSKLSNITVSEEPVLPVANFSSNVTEGYAPLTVEFTDGSENADEWNWDFGDGSNSTDQNTTHAYSVAGNYTVNLTVSNANGTDSIESIISVTDEPVLPVANFTSNVTEGYAPLSVQFNDSSENEDEWSWDFGDGSSSTEQNPVHTYLAAGNFTVNLTASNVNGTDSTFATITVSEEPVLPVANFSGNVTEGYVPLSVEFTDSSENADEWSWDFGDGSNSTDQNTTYTYPVAGNYTVNLTVSNVNGTDSIESIITVTEAPVLPVANFTSNVTDGYVPLTVEFSDSSENADEWNWDFGDGSNSIDQNTTHTYSIAGNFTVNLTVSNLNGTNSTESIITVTEDPVLPVANFTSNVTEGYVPLSVEFTDLSENVTDWYWDFGDGSNSTDQNTTHTYSTAGNYTVNLTASNVNGTNSTFATITVSEVPVHPVANFTSNVTEGSAPLTVEFIDSSENATEWFWDFGDGSNSTDQNTTHAYPVAGNYTVNLTVSNANGTDSIESIISVTDEPVLPVANFTSNVTEGSAPLTVEFTDGSENADDWIWDFGDGSNSTEQNPVHTFPTIGNFTVNLTAINLNGTDSKTIDITVLSEDLTLPVANFSSNVTEGYVPLTVQFNDSSENVTEWFWDFGDGNNSTIQNPIHIYSETGNFTVNLTAINLNGTDSKTVDITVLSEDLILPVANFTMNETSGYAPLAVQFNDSSENATEWFWDFGDGSNSTEQNPVHIFSTVGNFTVNLTAINGNGTNSKTANITVLSEDLILPVANFSSNVSSGYAPLSVEFTDSSDNATGWNWEFGDGSNSTEQNPLHIFSAAGNYTVNLTVSNEDGNDSTESTIAVTEEPVLPIANFTSNVSSGYAPLSVEFTDSSENADEWNWDFGDGVNSTEQNPVHIYSAAGNYTVNLTVINGNGTDSKLSNITVSEEPILPVANFTSNVTEGYAPLAVQFTDSSENADEWNWDFGDGNDSTEQNPIHTYSTAGNYTVNLTASNVNGTDSKFANITVSDHIYAYSIEKTITDVSGNSSSANITKAGDIVSYQIYVENEGNLNLTNVSVIDSFINLTGPAESLTSDDVLEVSENWTYTGNYTVTQEDLNNNGGGDGFINNTATVDCDELDAKNDSVLVPIEQNPECTIKKFVVDIAGNGTHCNISSAGDVVGFRVNVTNSGNIELSNISIRDSLVNLTGPYGDIGLFGLYQSSLDQYTDGGGDGILSVGETWYYLGNYTVTQEDLNSNGGGDGFLNSTVTFESSETDPINESSIQYLDENGNESNDSGNSSSGIQIEWNPDCSFTKSVLEVINGKDGAVNDAGDIIRYRILVENEGNVELTGVSVSDPMITLTSPVESLHSDGILELGENWTYTGNYTVTGEDMNSEGDGDEDIDNTATLSCNELSNKTSSAEVALIVPESSSGSSGSSGGSGGGSPEPAKNVEVKEISQTFVTNGKAVQFDFTKNATCVVYVNFDAKKTAGKTTTIAEQLKNKSTLVSSLTEGKVYKYFNVWVGNSGFATSSNIDNPGICFKVKKSWMQDENIDQDSITLNRYSNKAWKQLPATLLKEDSKYLYFTADVPGYTFFAITGKSNASSGGSVTEIKPEESEYVEKNTGNNNVKPETADEENAGESGSKLGILSLIAFFLIACLAVVFLYLKRQKEQK